jgi:hypothetical protein
MYSIVATKLHLSLLKSLLSRTQIVDNLVSQNLSRMNDVSTKRVKTIMEASCRAVHSIKVQ